MEVKRKGKRRRKRATSKKSNTNLRLEPDCEWIDPEVNDVQDMQIQIVPVEGFADANVLPEIPSAIRNPIAHASTDQVRTRTDAHQDSHATPEENLNREKMGEPNNLATENTCTTLLNMAWCFGDVNSRKTFPLHSSHRLTKVGPYSTKPYLAPILIAIIEKYGDIAKDCSFEDPCKRSYLLELVCKAVHKLQAIPFNHLLGPDLKDLDSALTTVESFKLKVDWLRQRHTELMETVRSFRPYPNLKTDLAKTVEDTTAMEKTLGLKKDCMKKLTFKCMSLESQLASLAEQIKDVDSRMSTIASRRERFSKSLIDGVI